MTDADPLGEPSRRLDLDREQIVALLSELGGELSVEGIRADLFAVGGAAMALAYDSRRTTSDVDAIFVPKNKVYEAARLIAERHNLPEDWLNDGVKGMLPGDDPSASDIAEVNGIRVSVPSPRYMLALKVAAARVDRDADDIETLARACGVDTAHEILDVAEQVLGGGGRLSAKSQFFIQEMFPARVPPHRRWWWQWRRKQSADGQAPSARPRRTSAQRGICGAGRADGGRCQNPRGSCPHH